MTWFASSLWELLKKPGRPGKSSREKKKPSAADTKPAPTRMQMRYDDLVSEMKKKFGVRVRKWRSGMTGCAWEVHYANGGISRLVESPYPKGPMSCAIFLHEIGHHAIGFGTYKPRCLEEYYAWKWSLDFMREKGFNVTARVEKRMADSLRYALDKSRRRGLKHIPNELLPYVSDASS